MPQLCEVSCRDGQGLVSLVTLELTLTQCEVLHAGWWGWAWSFMSSALDSDLLVCRIRMSSLESCCFT